NSGSFSARPFRSPYPGEGTMTEKSFASYLMGLDGEVMLADVPVTVKEAVRVLIAIGSRTVTAIGAALRRRIRTERRVLGSRPEGPDCIRRSLRERNARGSAGRLRDTHRRAACRSSGRTRSTTRPRRPYSQDPSRGIAG